MTSLVIYGDTSGSIALQANAVAGTNTITLPNNTGTVVTTGSSNVVTQTMLSTGLAGNGPSFYVTSSGTTFTSNTFVKIVLDTEAWDTNNNFASSKFTPTVAGYYQINAWCTFASAQVFTQLQLYKNGSGYGSPVQIANTSGCYVSNIVYCNGSTDYVEVYAYSSGTTQGGGGGMSGFLARAA